MAKFYYDIRVTGSQDELQEFLQLLAKIEYLGITGANRELVVVVDGDGSGQLNFSTLNENEPKVYEKVLDIVKAGQRLRGDTKPFRQQINGEMDKHYIGE